MAETEAEGIASRWMSDSSGRALTHKETFTVCVALLDRRPPDPAVAAADLEAANRIIEQRKSPVNYDLFVNDADAVARVLRHRLITPDPAVAELVEALRRALPSVQSDAEMMDAIDRHNPLPAADMPAVTKAANELDVLVDDIRALLAKHAAKQEKDHG